MLKYFPTAFAFLIGGVGLWTGFKQLRNRRELEKWPTTSGRVIERGTFRPNIATTSQWAFRYAPLVRYAFTVLGADFESNQIHPSRIQLPQHGSIKWAAKRAKAFPDSVTVHYNPQTPNECFILMTPRIWLYAIVLGSMLVILYGLVLIAIS